MKKIGKILLWIVGLFVALLMCTLLYLKAMSPGTTQAITDANGKIVDGSVAEITYQDINGIDQFLIIRGKSVNNPVLLMLHGGPGGPQGHLTLLHNKALEDHYIVVNWDQRGAGASYYNDIPEESMTVEQFVEDTKAVSEYLCKRFGKEKIFLLGHSWGSYLGMRTIKKYPDLFHAYIGIGQVADFAKSEMESYKFVLNKAKETNNEEALSELKEIGFPENGIYKNPEKAMQIQRKWVTEYGGSAYGKTADDFFNVMLKPLFTFKEYQLMDKFNYMKGMQFSQRFLYQQMFEERLVDVVTEVKVPVYVMHGLHDYQTIYSEAKSYIDSLKAPAKIFITFDNSAHLLPYINEIDKFHDIMNVKVLNEINPN